MSSELLSQSFFLWKDARIGKPPQREELVLSFSEIRKALLSFKFDMLSSGGTKLDPAQAILINDKLVQNLELPPNPKSQSLEFVERKDIDVTNLLKTGSQGERNIVEVNYLLSSRSIVETKIPGKTIGTLTLEIKVFYPGIKEVIVKPPNFKYCMWCGKSIPRDSVICGYCKQMPPPGGTQPKKCNNCNALLPPQAKYCEDCGSLQASEQKGTKSCVSCMKTISADAVFCDKCGAKQPEGNDTTSAEEKTFCVRCGNPLSPDSAFCGKCGAQQPAQH